MLNLNINSPNLLFVSIVKFLAIIELLYGYAAVLTM